MKLDLFKTLAPELQNLTSEITLHVMGEPLLHPHLDEILSVGQDHSLAVTLTTNGAYLDRNNNLLTHQNLRQVNISLHGAYNCLSPVEFGKYFRNVLEWTQHALHIRPDLYINYRLWNEDAKILLEQIEEAFGVQLNKRVDVGWKKSKKVLPDQKLYLNFDSQFTWPELKLPKISDEGSCYALHSHIAILSDGRVVPCCLDKDGVLALGKISASQSLQESQEPKEPQESLLTILQKEKARSMKEGFSHFERREELCKRCDYISRFS